MGVFTFFKLYKWYEIAQSIIIIPTRWVFFCPFAKPKRRQIFISLVVNTAKSGSVCFLQHLVFYYYLSYFVTWIEEGSNLLLNSNAFIYNSNLHFPRQLNLMPFLGNLSGAVLKKIFFYHNFFWWNWRISTETYADRVFSAASS